MNQIVKYFTGEKQESFLFLSFGVIGVAMALYFFFGAKTSFLKGIAIPFILISVLEIIVGVTIIDRSPRDIIRVERYLMNKSEMVQKTEIPRMEKVMKNFFIYRCVEIILIVIGMILMYSFRHNLLWNGIGLGLFIQSSIVLILDFFAERRGEIYLSYLRTLIGN